MMSLEGLSRRELIRTAQAIRERENRIERARQEQSLLDFVRYFWDVLEPGREFVEGEVIAAMCEHLEAVARGEITRILSNVSPGFMKSLLTDVFFPAWVWGPGNRPSARFVAFSYAAHLTVRDNTKFRDLVRSRKYQELWGFRVSLVGEGRENVTNSATGFKFASSIGGVGTGERGDFVILDDPHNVKEAESETVRRETCRWFREALQNRLNDPENSAIIVIMQRVHEEDVSGVILSEYPEYTHFCVPMEYEEGRHCETEIGWSDWRTADGELAWPERFPEHTLAPFKRLPFLWAGQYQQRPEPRGGGILKREWWQDWNDEAAAYYGIKPGAFPPMELIIASLDPAYTEKEENDPSALTIWGLWRDRQDNPMVMLMNAWQKRLEIHGPLVEREPNEPEHAFLARTKPEWGLVEWVTHSCNRFKVDKLLIEAKASGHSVFQEIKRLNRYASWSTSLIDPGRQDKVARAYAVQPHFANAQVFAPLSRGWADEVVSQAASFPKGTHDDLVDSAGQALRWLRDQGFLQRPDEIVADFTAENTHRGRSRPIYDV